MKTISDYSKSDFIQLVTEIMNASGTEDYQDELLEHFIEVTEHPAGSDLIYYPETGAEATPESIVEAIQKWRINNGKQGFKDS